MTDLNVRVLGYIYHGLGEAASHLDHPGKANTFFPIYYAIGWLVELFPSLYRRRPDGDYPGGFLSLVYYAGLLSSKLSLPQARHVFRDRRYLSLRDSSYREDSRNGEDVIDMGLLDEDFKFFLSIRSSILPAQPSDSKGMQWILHKPMLIFKGEIEGLSSMFLLPIVKEELLASRARVSQSLSALRSMIDIYKLSTIEIYWFSSKIEEIFSIVETAVKIKDLVYVDRVKTCSSKITHIEDQLNNLSSKASKLKVKEQEVKADLVEAGFSKVQDLEKEKNHLKSLIDSIISFNNV
ncbi:hypothetical protein Cgig2_007620 [Carnegiea gigantea]|uniref:Aminotransferase-like plant mobile domain-containing protein n=1 Tax=Carnegiea gigantea TaxID=171969 RepID=A0A9Q1JNY4_9CARY|nr:hypothetical protein Cgig2_007620 [Carnegiea gigantea]